MLAAPLESYTADRLSELHTRHSFVPHSAPNFLSGTLRLLLPSPDPAVHAEPEPQRSSAAALDLVDARHVAEPQPVRHASGERASSAYGPFCQPFAVASCSRGGDTHLTAAQRQRHHSQDAPGLALLHELHMERRCPPGVPGIVGQRQCSFGVERLLLEPALTAIE